jgi:uncharacterized damage-inducible protein DinB
MAANNRCGSPTIALLAACAQLSQEDFVATDGLLSILKSTLNHIVTVAGITSTLERALRGQPPNTDAGRFFDPEEPFATCAELMAAQHAVDARLLAACRELTDAQMDMPVAVARRAGVQYESVTRLLAHLFEHQIHHRGQAHAMLAGTPVKPPQLDEFFCANEAHLRARELAEIGLSESAVWS